MPWCTRRRPGCPFVLAPKSHSSLGAELGQGPAASNRFQREDSSAGATQLQQLPAGAPLLLAEPVTECSAMQQVLGTTIENKAPVEL